MEMYMGEMTHVPGNRRVWKRFFACLLAATFAWSCSRDAEAPMVDFSRTISVERRQNNSTQEFPALRVAVGAMISPKETFIHYQELLTYMGRKIGMAAGVHPAKDLRGNQ
jgi:hypothetical protein